VGQLVSEVGILGAGWGQHFRSFSQRMIDGGLPQCIILGLLVAAGGLLVLHGLRQRSGESVHPFHGDRLTTILGAVIVFIACAWLYVSRSLPDIMSKLQHYAR
jgi:hypothetical protein